MIVELIRADPTSYSESIQPHTITYFSDFPIFSETSIPELVLLDAEDLDLLDDGEPVLLDAEDLVLLDAGEPVLLVTLL